MKKTVLILLASAILMVACGRLPVKVQSTDSITRSPNPGTVAVFNSSSEIQKPYQQIATIEAEDKRLPGKRSKEELVNRIVAKAKEIGADGIIMVTNAERHRTMSDGMGGSSEQIYLYAKAIAFVYKQ